MGDAPKKRRKWTHETTSAASVLLEATDESIDNDHEVVQKILVCFSSGDPATTMEELDLLLKEFKISSFTPLLRLPEVLNTLPADIFWIMHLNGLIEFADYISLAEESSIVLFIRKNYLASIELFDHSEDDDNAVPLSICADVVLYLFKMTELTGSNVSSASNFSGSSCIEVPTASVRKANHILSSSFLPVASNGPLHSSDIRLFSDLLATISCSSECEAVLELQIQQISRLLSYQVCLHSTPAISFIPAVQVVSDTIGSISTSVSSTELTASNGVIGTDLINGSHSSTTNNDDNNGNDNQKNPLNAWISADPFECLIGLKLPLIVYLKAFDRALRVEEGSPFSHQESYCVMADTTPGNYSVVSILFESAVREGLLQWKTNIPNTLTAKTIACHTENCSNEGVKMNKRNKIDKRNESNYRNENNLNYRDRDVDITTEHFESKSFPLVSMVYLAAAAAKAAITEVRANPNFDPSCNYNLHPNEG
jgi:hypothetical protein